VCEPNHHISRILRGIPFNTLSVRPKLERKSQICVLMRSSRQNLHFISVMTQRFTVNTLAISLKPKRGNKPKGEEEKGYGEYSVRVFISYSTLTTQALTRKLEDFLHSIHNSALFEMHQNTVNAFIYK
jgi:hypothetical protein